MKRVPSVAWAFFGLAVVIYLVYLLNRGVFVGSDARLYMSPMDIFVLEHGRSPATEETVLPPPPDSQVIAFAQMNGKDDQLAYYKICRYLHLTGISASFGVDGLGKISSPYPGDLFCPPLKKS